MGANKTHPYDTSAARTMTGRDYVHGLVRMRDKHKRSMADRYYRARSAYRRLKRLAFPSPAETRFIELMGGKVWRLGFIRLGNGWPLTIILSSGKILRAAKMKREVRYGRYYVDFANDIHWVIEIDGGPWHQDVVAEMDREIYIRDLIRRSTKNRQDLRLLRVPAPRIWNDKTRLQNQVISFLNT